MTKAATIGELQELHAKVAESLKTRLADDLKDGIPTDAATLGAAIKFLKDNNVSADPADADDLNGMRDMLAQQRAQRKAKASAALELVKLDVKEA